MSMNTVVKRITMLYVFAIVFIAIAAVLMYSMFSNAQEYALKPINGHLFDNGTLLNAGAILDVNGEIIAYSEEGERKYSEDASTRAALLHILGDNAGFIDGGIQSKFRDELCGYDIAYGVNKDSENKMNLTLDAELCAYAYEKMLPYKGCVAICNYETGELICIASAPSYDMLNKPENIADNPDYEGVYINRLFGGLYTPGSIFKLVTAVGAIENIDDIFSQSFTCNGKYDTGEGTVICNDVHGTITFKQALNYSCNCAFADISIQLGASTMSDVFSQIGLDSKTENSDRITNTAGVYKTSNSSTLGELGWSGIGQGATLINPYSFLTFVSAIANGGSAYEPYFIQNITDGNGDIVYLASPKEAEISIKSSTAKTLKEMMRSTVSDYYGDYMFGDLEICGKTGTAEIDDKEPHSWFVGFSADTDFPYAIITVIENRGSGLKYAGSTSAEILQELYNKIN